MLRRAADTTGQKKPVTDKGRAFYGRYPSGHRRLGADTMDRVVVKQLPALGNRH